jgi:cell division septum initiation protein DivIVA
MGDGAEQRFEADGAVTPAELRTPDLPLQRFGGYSRTATDRLLNRAATTLEQLAERVTAGPPPDEQSVGEALVTAHRVAEAVRTEARAEAEALIAAARTQAQEIVQEAVRRADDLRVEHAQTENALAQARQQAQVAEREITELHDEARRVRSVIDEFRTQWSNLISGALRQLELRMSGADQADDGAGSLERDLRERLVEPAAEEQRAAAGTSAVGSTPGESG